MKQTKTNPKTKIIQTALFSLCLGLTACFPPGEGDPLTDAQICLDRAAYDSSALQCVSSIANLTTPAANGLKCTAHFMSAGIVASTYMGAASQGGTNATFLSLLDLKVTNAEATQIASYCSQSGSEIMSLFGSMAESATIVANTLPANIATVGPTEMKSALDTIMQDISNDPTAHQDVLTAVGGSILQAYQVTCPVGGEANTEVCAAVTTATNSLDLNAATAEEIGNALLSYWNTQAP